MDGSPEQPIKDVSTESVSFKDLASLLNLGVEGLNQRASDALERMPEVKAAMIEDLNKRGIQGFNRTLALSMQNIAMTVSTEVLEATKLSTGVVIKAKEIFGPKKE